MHTRLDANRVGAAALAVGDASLRALALAWNGGDVALGAGDRVLFSGARPGLSLPTGVELLCQQDFKPLADALEQAGLRVGAPEPGQVFDVVLLGLPRSREARRWMFAQALEHVRAGGVIVTACANAEGARSAEDDLGKLVGAVRQLSKFKCRVFWTHMDVAQVDRALQQEWLALDALRPTAEGLVSRPGLFAWDRIDPASALLAEHLPPDLAGRVADLGAGAGYLSVQVLRRCPQVRHIDLYEADARALPAARVNLQAARAARAAPVDVVLHWHDVVTGLPGTYQAIVSNPPFHQGHAGLPELGQAFLLAAARALEPGGRLLLVANRHLPYEGTLAAHFRQSRVLAGRDGFKVIEAWR